MARVQSENVVRYEDVFLSPITIDGTKSYHLCIVMEVPSLEHFNT